MLLAGGLAVLNGGDAVADLTAARLRCEHRGEPRGVDLQRPELSWIVTSDQRAQVQSAYRVLVASSPERLAADEGDLWDTGKVTGNATYGLRYAGAPLRSHQPCYWKVMAWDGEDRPGAWSEAAHWTVGLLDPADWSGQWIGSNLGREANQDPPAIPLDGAQWIRHAADGVPKPPAGLREYRGVWDLPSGVDLRTATLAICSDDSARVVINGVEAVSVTRLAWPETEEVASHLRPGRNEFRVTCKNNSPGPTGLCLKVVAEAFSGERYVLRTDGDWSSVAADDGSDAGRPVPVDVVGPFGCEPWGRPAYRRDVSAPPAYLRSDFSVDAKVVRATAYLATLGWADLTINGQRVNTDYFSSGWTDYRKRVYYREYDATDLIRQGENAWGAVLADGWYSGHVGWDMRRDHYGRSPRLRAMLRVEYENGEVRTFATDEDWRASVSGPKRLADSLVGEEYDATREMNGWDEHGFDDSGWVGVETGAEVSPRIEWHPGPPVVEVGRFQAETVSEPAPGVYVYDLGQNFAGVVRLRVSGRRGQRVRLRFAERLTDDGMVYTDNLRMARATDFYTCRGGGEEVWLPTQTFHGFQYVELTGVEDPGTEAVTGVALSSHTPLASGFECSDEAINQLYQNVLWTQRANFIDVPTDCPQRDERLGWTGDAQVYVRTACLTSDVQAFFHKWLRDLTDAQRDDGQFPKVAPVILSQDDGGPAWADAGVICPWEIYRAYGDADLLERQYPSMVRFVEFCRTRSKDEVLPPDSFHCFGDWLSVNADTPKEVIYTAYYARSVDLLRRSAEALGKKDDARRYGLLFDRIREAFVDECVSTDGVVLGDTQCAYVLAIGYGLVEGDLREKAARRLVDDIRTRGWRLSTGFVGTKDLLLVLSEIGRQDVALRLLHQPEYPGWLFSISHGATSIWERWDGWTPDRGFQSVGMNSFAHYSFGAVYGWMVENLGGIRAASPGYGRVVIEPVFDPQLDFCRVTYDSVRGPIETEWRTGPERRELKVAIPANVTATVRLRGTSADDVLIDGVSPATAGVEVQNTRDVYPATGETDKQKERPTAELRLPSGTYLLTGPI